MLSFELSQIHHLVYPKGNSPVLLSERLQRSRKGSREEQYKKRKGVHQCLGKKKI